MNAIVILDRNFEIKYKIERDFSIDKFCKFSHEIQKLFFNVLHNIYLFSHNVLL